MLRFGDIVGVWSPMGKSRQWRNYELVNIATVNNLHTALLRRDFPAFFDEPSSFGGRLLGGGEILLG
jgi:hypothetical protein